MHIYIYIYISYVFLQISPYDARTRIRIRSTHTSSRKAVRADRRAWGERSEGWRQPCEHPYACQNPWVLWVRSMGGERGDGRRGRGELQPLKRPLRIPLPAGVRKDLRANPLVSTSEPPLPPRLIPLFHPHRARFGAPRVSPSRPAHSPHELGDLNGGRTSQGSKKKTFPSFRPQKSGIENHTRL